MKTGTKLIVFIAGVAAVNCTATVIMLYLNTPVSQSVLIELALFAACVIACAIFVEHILNRPISALIKSMKEYKSGGKLTKSDRKDEIGQLQNSYSELNAELESERSKQNRIIASISHDIKTPLTSVLGYTEFLKNPNLPPERRMKYINTIYAKALEIKDIVIEFDDYLSCNLNSNLDCEFVKVGELLEYTAKEMREEILADGLTITYKGCACDGEVVYIDKSKLHRVFMNVVANAAKHAGKEKINVTFKASVKGEDIEFTITDDGNGCKADELPHLFEPMYTTDKSRSVAGLGLAICKEIITAHGGKIKAESEPGKSFSVIFTLKRAKVEA